MKNLKWFIVGIIASFIMVPRIYAAPVGSSNLDYSSCYAFADVFIINTVIVQLVVMVFIIKLIW